MAAFPFFPAQAQSLLPPGVVAVRAQYREMLGAEQVFDGHGKRMSVGDLYRTPLRGPEMRKGAFGSDLKRLADELARYDGASSPGISDRLDLGTFRVNVSAEMRALGLGLAAGVTPWLTAYVGVPLVSATVRADFRMEGVNNAQAIKAELGELAYDELKAGLDEASRVDAARILRSLEGSGYSTQNSWSVREWGDVRLGVMADPQTALGLRMRNWSSLVTTELVLPTAYRDKPGVLVDVALGKGYPALAGTFEARYLGLSPFRLLGALGGAYNFESTVYRWVPAGGSTLSSIENERRLTQNPGADLEGRLGASAPIGFAEPSLAFRVETHFQDLYTDAGGRRVESLETKTDSERYSGEVAVTLSSIDSWKRGGLFPPLLATFLWKYPLGGRNRLSEHFVELSLTAFVPTPWSVTTARLE